VLSAISGLKQLIAMKTADRSKPGVQSGVPKDSLTTNCEWIYNSMLNIEINQRIANSHQGDENIHNQIGYGCFAKQKINNFNLVYWFESYKITKKH
jgi:hypothetical protein